MAKKQITISGKIVDKKGNSLESLKVEAWDKDKLIDDFAGSSVTDSDGKFKISFNQKYFKELFLDRSPDLYFKIYKDDKLIHSTEETVIWNINNDTDELTFTIDYEAETGDDGADENQIAISGTLVKDDGTVIVGATIKVLNKNLRSEDILGESNTDENGAFEIKLESTGPKDIIVRAYENNSEIASSDTYFNLSKSKTIQLVLGNKEYKGPSETKQLIEKASGKLEGLKLSSLTEDERNLLSGKTGVSTKKLTALANAESLSDKVGISKDFFYGLINGGLNGDLNSLAIQPDKVFSNKIKSAAAKNEIPETEADDSTIQSNIGNLRTAAAKDTLTANDDSTSMYNILGTTKLNETQKEKFLVTLYKNSNNYTKTFEALKEDKDFDSGLIDGVKTVFEIGSLSENHSPVIKAINQKLTGKTALSSYSMYSKNDWKTFISENKTSFPTTTEGDTDDEKLDNYSETLMRNFEKAFPGEKVKGKLLADNPDDNVKKFFENSSDFDIGKTQIQTYIIRNSDKLKAKVTDLDKVTKELKTLQRLYRITPDEDKYDKIKILKDNNLDSANSISKKFTRNGFKKEFAEKFGSDKIAEDIIDRSVYIANLATGMTSYIVHKKSTKPKAIGSGVTKTGGEIEIPDWETLFGSTSYCECEECRSVLSPAAYLVDLLEFLNIDGAKILRDILLKRRPDIGNILLSCQNTNTALPYIDLVIEILEISVLLANGYDERDGMLRNASTEINIKYQTVGTTAELQSQPEHIIKEAYDYLQTAVYPFGLPFQFWNKEADVYIEKLGFKRYELLKKLQCKGETNEPTNLDVALVHLGLSDTEKRIIAGTYSMIIKIIGPAGNEIEKELFTIDKFYGLDSADYVSELQNVETFLDKTGLVYNELLKLLQVKFVNPDSSVELNFSSDSNCDTSTATLKNADNTFFEKVHRFLRLNKLMNWGILELGKAIESTGEVDSTDFTDSFFIKLSTIKYLKEELKIDLEELISWWTTLDTDTDSNDTESRSFYEQLFLNKAVINPIPTDYVFLLNDDKTKLKIEETGIAADVSLYLSEIASALNVTTSDLELLIEKLSELTGNSNLTFENLSVLHRIASAAKAFDIEVKEFLILMYILPVNPFNNSDFNPVTFYEHITKIKESGFSILQLDYIFRHKFNLSDNNTPAETDITSLLATIKDGLEKINKENSYTTDPTGEITQTKLQQILDQDTAKQIIDVLNEFSPFNITDEMTAAEKDSIVSNRKSVLSSNLTFLSLTDIDKFASIDETLSLQVRIQNRYSILFSPLLVYVIKQLHIEYLSQIFSEDLELDLDTSMLLITGLAKYPGDSTKFAYEVFIDHVYTTDDQKKTYYLLDKAAQILTGFGFNNKEVIWIYQNNTNGWLDLNKLVTSETEGSSGLFKSWLTMYEFSVLNRLYRTDDLQLIDILDKSLNDTSANVNSLNDYLSSLTSWEKGDLNFLAGTTSLNLNKEDFKDGHIIYTLYEIIQLVESAGVSAKIIWDWSYVDLKASQSKSIRDAVKAKYTVNEWLSVAPGLRNNLRPLQRDALLSYVLNNEAGLRKGIFGPDYESESSSIEDENDLINFLLLDLKVESEFLTARIKQACSSVQMFIQRSFMGLESGVTLDEELKDEWEWKKHYRYWEANRKVFLWPENWLEPELRSTKSEIFEELETELLQDEINDENVERALVRYLEKVDKLSHLLVVATYNQMDSTDYEFVGPMVNFATLNELSDNNLLHVFARTLTEPYEYYYRKYNFSTDYWSSWEILDLDIETDILIPVVIYNRLFLFWPVFNEESMSSDTFSNKYFDDLGDDYSSKEDMKTAYENLSEQYKYYNIKMAFSEYKYDKWSAKKISDETLFTYNKLAAYQFWVPELVNLDNSNYFFTWDSINDLLIFKCIQRNNFIQMDTYEQHVYVGGFVFNFNTQYINMYKYADPSNFESLSRPINSNVIDSIIEEESDSSELILTNPTIPLLSKTPGDYLLTLSGQYSSYVVYLDDILEPHKKYFFYQDSDRRYFVKLFKSVKDMQNANFKCSFYNFYHPYVTYLLTLINKENDISFTMKRDIQRIYNDDFKAIYEPEDSNFDLSYDYPLQEFDFQYGKSYFIYNWEFFYYIPMLIADYLSQNQEFELSQKWYQFIFNPTDSSMENAPQKYWQLRPFFEKQAVDNIYDLLLALSNEEDSDDKKSVAAQIEAWTMNPFEPHVIAELRTEAYMMNTFMKYLDNLIAWADSLFLLDTIEYINEATQLYILASDLLGDKPEEIPSTSSTDKTYNELTDEGFDDFSNSLISDIEDYINTSIQSLSIVSKTNLTRYVGSCTYKIDSSKYFYFCIPNNDNLLKYWETVEDRLFKIRNCQNIEGVTRSLALYEPAIDPALLINAIASGVDIGSILSDILSPLPNYRFKFFIQKATQFCNDLQSLGGALLSALEKKDAEANALIRSSHELNLLQAVKDLKKMQVDETEESYNSLLKSKDVAEIRYNYYKDIKKRSAGEILQLGLAGAAKVVQGTVQIAKMLSSVSSNTPGTKVSSEIGVPPKLISSVTDMPESSNKASESWAALASSIEASANIAGIMASQDRRWDDWKLQEDLAKKEMEQYDKQIAAAEIRKAIAEKDLENTELQIEQSKEVYEWMTGKYTNEELYKWMSTQISKLYFQSYQLAYDCAKRAQRAFQYELNSDQTFVQYGYWDSLKKGLLAGEKLLYDLKRMEMSYYEQNKRQFEITKNISLAQLDPAALIMLRETGECFVTLPEVIFDLDYPGHYQRRIKSVALTIPCITGPYTNLNCTLTLLENKFRKDPSTSGEYKETDGSTDSRFAYNLCAIQSIATSSGRNDSGVFQLNFEDERYLPFEGSGAISKWRLQLPTKYQAFDYDTISDVIFHLSYTSKDGGETLKTKAKDSIDSLINAIVLGSKNTGLSKMFSAKYEFPNEWYQMSVNGNTITFKIEKENFPYIFYLKTISLTSLSIFVLLKSEDSSEFKAKLGTDTEETSLASFNDSNGDTNDFIKTGAMNDLDISLSTDVSLRITNSTGGSAIDNLDDIILLFSYKVSS